MRVFIGLKIFAATPRRRALRKGEAFLHNDVEIFAAAYPKVEKGRLFVDQDDMYTNLERYHQRTII